MTPPTSPASLPTTTVTCRILGIRAFMGIMAGTRAGCFAPGNRGGVLDENLVFVTAVTAVASARQHVPRTDRERERGDKSEQSDDRAAGHRLSYWIAVNRGKNGGRLQASVPMSDISCGLSHSSCSGVAVGGGPPHSSRPRVATEARCLNSHQPTTVEGYSGCLA